MESRVELAKQKHKQGYNCAQAVICTYCDLFGLSEDEAFRISESFGAGMGMQETCGAVSGMFMLLGLEKSGGLNQVGKTKRETYNAAKELGNEFAKKEGTIICKDMLKNKERTCTQRVADAAVIIEKYLNENKK